MLSIIKNALFILGIILLFFSLIYLGNTPFVRDFLLYGVSDENLFLALFFISLFGGFSFGGTAAFLFAITLLLSYGLDPFAVAFISGSGIALGDCIVFFLLERGRYFIGGRFDKILKRIERFFNRKKFIKKFIPLFSYMYISFLPLPNDILLLFLVSIRYKWHRVILLLIAGNFTFTILFVYLGDIAITAIFEFTTNLLQSILS